MNKTLYISTVLDQPGLLEDMVERLAYKRNDIGYSREQMPSSHIAIESSSGETYVSGTVAIEDGRETIQMPFITCFLFTCTRGRHDPYKLTWSTSLS